MCVLAHKEDSALVLSLASLMILKFCDCVGYVWFLKVKKTEEVRYEVNQI